MKTLLRSFQIILLALFIFCSACQSSNPAMQIQVDDAPTTIQSTVKDNLILPISTLATSISEEETIFSPSNSVMTATPEPLNFVFPTPALASVSAWRPPLYPTPWVPPPDDHFYFARPIAANEINWPLAIYRDGGVFFAVGVHTGIDIPVKSGTPFYAA
jgi:murein DD-endopeptidase MepM/ murein hydrolase activator NlpD